MTYYQDAMNRIIDRIRNDETQYRYASSLIGRNNKIEGRYLEGFADGFSAALRIVKQHRFEESQ